MAGAASDAASDASNPLAAAAVPIAVKAETTARKQASVKKLQEAVDADPDDIDSWGQLLRSLRSQPELARQAYTTFLKRFPTASHVILDYAKMELAAGEISNTKTLLGKSVRNSLDPELWQFYVDFVRSTRLVVALKALSKVKTAKQAGSGEGASDEDLAKATSAVDSARSAVSQAFEFSLGKVGLLPGSDGLWDAWLAFVRSMPSGTEYEVEQRREQLRKALQRAVAVPMARVASRELWTEYEAFEKDNAQDMLASRLLEQHRPAFVTASAVAQERSALWAKINPHLVPVQPPTPTSPTGAAAAAGGTKTGEGSSEAAAKGFALVCEQVPLWRDLLRYEAKNPLRLPADTHATLMRAHLQRCLLSTRSLPHFWAELAMLELRAGGLLLPGEPLAALAERPDVMASPGGVKAAQAALKVFADGCQAARASQALAITAADVAELLGNNKLAAHLYEQASKHCAEAPIWTAWLRFVRRTDSAVAARRLFVAAKAQSKHPAVFLTAAEIEASANGEAATALKIIDLGRRRLHEAAAAGAATPQTLVNFCVAGCRIAMNHADAANTRSLFESCLESLRPEQRGALLALYLSYESRLASGGGDMKRLARLEMRCWREVGSLPGAPSASALIGEDGAATMTAQAHHWQAFGLAPASGLADVAMFRSSGFQPAMFHDSMGGLLLGNTATAAGAAAAGATASSQTGGTLTTAALHPSVLSSAPAGLSSLSSSSSSLSSSSSSAAAAAAAGGALRPPGMRQLDGQVAAPIPQASVPVHPSLLKAKAAAAAGAAPAAPPPAPPSSSAAAHGTPGHPSVTTIAAGPTPTGLSVGAPVPGFLQALLRPGMRLGPMMTRLALRLGPSSVTEWTASTAEAQFVIIKATQAIPPPHALNSQAFRGLPVASGSSSVLLAEGHSEQGKRQREPASLVGTGATAAGSSADTSSESQRVKLSARTR